MSLSANNYFDKSMLTVCNTLNNQYRNLEAATARTNSTNWLGRSPKLQCQVTEKGKETMVRVGASTMKAWGSLEVFKKFIQEVADHEIERVNRSAKIIEDLKVAESHILQILESQKSLETLRQELRGFRNELLRNGVRDQQIQAVTNRVQQMMKELNDVTIPSELNKETVSKHLEVVDTLKEKVSKEFTSFKEKAV